MLRHLGHKLLFLPDPDALAAVHLCGRLAVEVEGPLGAELDRLVEEADAVVLADAEDAEVPVVGGEGDVQVVELLAVLVDVGRHPAPVPVVVVVVVVPAEEGPGGMILFVIPKLSTNLHRFSE